MARPGTYAACIAVIAGVMIVAGGREPAASGESVEGGTAEPRPGRRALLDDVERRRALWAANRGRTGSAYLVQYRCECAEAEAGAVVVRVEGGRAVSARSAASGEELPGRRRDDFLRTLDDLFRQVAEEAARADEVAVVWHPKDGYPMHVSVDPDLDAVDDEYDLDLVVLDPGVAPAARTTGGGPANGRRLPIVVRGEVTPNVVAAGAAIPLAVRIENGLPGAVEFVGYGIEPTEWNGETVNVRLVDVYRDGEETNLYLKSPRVEPPVQVAGMSCEVVEPGRTLAVRTDARKWEIRGGWTPGRYRVTVRFDGLLIDDFATAGVLSAPFEFVIE